ncbi:MAG: TrkH family potassium uptake protein [Oscillospiraceae bacterium]|nr:TrkH family potassium uptake protein [Oscillospiraceae bacterium]
MNGAMIVYILGQVLRIEGLLMLPSFLVGLIYGERQGWVFLIWGLVCVLIGTLITLKKPKNTMIYLKEGCVSTALCWIILSAFGAAPFVLTGEIPRFIDAMFETVSGFTTTGSSILTDVEAMSHPSLFWRGFTHWIGGMGVLVFLLAVLPMAGGSQFQLMKAESPGPSVGKLVPKVGATARILYIIYFVMTIVEIVLLLLGGMDAFDAVTLSFGTAGTGGFGVKGDSCASYSSYCIWVITIFMILFGVNFNAYYFLLIGSLKKAFAMEEVRWYFIIILASTAIIFPTLLGTYAPFEALTHAAFQVGTIITTTGFATADFDLWSSLAKTVLVLLMFIGACAGSTGGGIKVSRVIVFVKSAVKEVGSYIHPRSIKRVKVEGRPVEHEAIRSINVYLTTYVLIFVLSVFLISLEGKDLVTTFTSVAATFNNIGPGLELVGPTGSFAHMTDLSKWVLIFDMLAGRLELFPMLILFHPTIWKQLFQRCKGGKT